MKADYVRTSTKPIPLVRGAVVQVGRGDARCAGSVIVGQLYQALHDDAVQSGLNARSWGASTPMKMCIQADLDDADALRHMNKNNSNDDDDVYYYNC